MSRNLPPNSTHYSTIFCGRHPYCSFTTMSNSFEACGVVPDPNISADDVNDVSGAVISGDTGFIRSYCIPGSHMAYNNECVCGSRLGQNLNRARLSLAESLANHGNLFRGSRPHRPQESGVNTNTPDISILPLKVSPEWKAPIYTPRWLIDISGDRCRDLWFVHLWVKKLWTSSK